MEEVLYMFLNTFILLLLNHWLQFPPVEVMGTE